MVEVAEHGASEQGLRGPSGVAAVFGVGQGYEVGDLALTVVALVQEVGYPESDLAGA